MPWTKVDYPNSMRNLPKMVRNKAIEIANAIYSKGKLKVGNSIAIAILNAKKWAKNRGFQTIKKIIE
jgi:uncharacterized protein YdaT